MKKIFLAVVLLAASAAFFGLRAVEIPGTETDTTAKPRTVTLTGTLVDISCYVEDGYTGNDHGGMKGCGTECLNGGSPAGLLSGKKLYTLAFPAPAFKDYVGQTLEIAGKLYLGDQLVPRKVFVVKDGKKTEVNIKGKSVM